MFIKLLILLVRSLLLFILKKDNFLRLYINYYILNNIIIKDKYTLLLINKF